MSADTAEKYHITSAEFVLSAPKLSALPKESFPEAAFTGRSNVGKSSLMNALCGQKSLARTGKTPGRTQALNYFDISFRAESGGLQHAYFVDLPGYGFAKVPQPVRRSWEQLIEGYLLERETLQVVLLLIDCRREPAEEEHRLADLGRDGNFFVVLTKADKLKSGELSKRKKAIREQLSIDAARVLSVGLIGKRKHGVDELRERILKEILVSRY